MEVFVSANFFHVWEALLGSDFSDGPTGFFGAASSIVIIADATRKAMRNMNFTLFT
jgi:hypothetical protein